MSFGDLSPLLYTAAVCDSLAVGGCPNVLGIVHCRFCELRSRMYKSFRYLTTNNINKLVIRKFILMNKFMLIIIIVIRVLHLMHHLGMLCLGSSLSFAKPPNRKALRPTSVKLCPSLGQGDGPFGGWFGYKCFHSHLLACNS